MSLGNFLSTKEILGNKYNIFLKLKKKLEKEGIPKNIATYNASIVLTPDKLEKIKLLAKKRGTNQGKAIVFFFKDDEEINLVAKHFRMSVANGHEPQVGHSDLLIELLKLLEKL